MNESPQALLPGEKITNTWISQLLRAIRRQRPVAGPGLASKVTPDGTVLSAAVPQAHATAAGLAPFSLRHYNPTPDIQNALHRWMIYLPPGCLSVGGTCEPLNCKMTDHDGHENDVDWYFVDMKELDGGYRQETEGGSTVRYYERDIVVHSKTSAKVYGVDELSAPARRLFYVEARPRIANASGQPRTQEQEAANFWGDEFSQVVGTVTIRWERTGDGQGNNTVNITRTVVQTVKTPISVAGRAATNFDLVWYFGTNEWSELTCEKVYCVRNQLSAAGITLSGPTMTEVTGATASIYAKIKTNPLNPSASSGTVEVVTDPSGMTTDNDLTWLRLYSISYNRVTADWRAQSLANVQVYR